MTNIFERQLIINGLPLDVLAEVDGYGKATGQQPQLVSVADFERDTAETICDCCASEIPAAAANRCDCGEEWNGATLCNDCYAEVCAPECDE